MLPTKAEAVTLFADVGMRPGRGTMFQEDSTGQATGCLLGAMVLNVIGRERLRAHMRIPKPGVTPDNLADILGLTLDQFLAVAHGFDGDACHERDDPDTYEWARSVAFAVFP